MKVLVINCGSSSLKYQLIDSETEEVMAKGLCERIGIDGHLTHKPASGGKYEYSDPLPTHVEAVSSVLNKLTDPEVGVIGDLSEIGAVGHRIVHGGEKFAAATLLTEEALAEIDKCSELAPLHNPANLIGIRACQKLMPGVPMVGVFDTAFHQTMPPKAYLYSIPYDYYERYKVRRYGFHGTSHSYVSKRAAEILGKDPKELKTIVCHLGNGASLSAVKYGKSVDTSMGFTPLDGLSMGTRSGGLDPAILEFLSKKEGLNIEELLVILNKRSGMLGLSGVSSDFRDLEAAAKEGNERCKTALDVFTYRVAKFIGYYTAAMNGVDVICFTAGIGENDASVRATIMSYLEFLGIRVDEAANNCHGEERIISTPDSKVTVMVVPTNEELAIARETVEIVSK